MIFGAAALKSIPTRLRISIKFSNNEMWIKNYIDEENSSFISIQNIDLKNMNAKNIKILAYLSMLFRKVIILRPFQMFLLT